MLDNEEKAGGQDTDGREQEDTDGGMPDSGAERPAEDPARAGAEGQMKEGGKPSILKALRDYEAPAPVPTAAERGREWR